MEKQILFAVRSLSLNCWSWTKKTLHLKKDAVYLGLCGGEGGESACLYSKKIIGSLFEPQSFCVEFLYSPYGFFLQNQCTSVMWPGVWHCDGHAGY